MKRPFHSLAILLTALSAQAADVIFNLEDFTTKPQAVRALAVYPIGAPYTNGAGFIVTRDRVLVTTGTNGSVIVSNVYGGGYRSELLGTYTLTTNFFLFPVSNGVINASDWTTGLTNALSGANTAYSQNAADGRFVHKAGDTMTGGLTNNVIFSGNGAGLTNLTVFQAVTVTNIDGRVWSNSPTDGYWHSGATYQAIPDRMVMTSPFHLDVSNNSGLTNELIIRNAGLHWTSQIVSDGGYVGDGSGLTNLSESGITGLAGDLSSKASTNDSRSLSFSGSNWLTGVLDLEYELRLTNSVGASGDVVSSAGAGKAPRWVTLGSAAFTASSAYDSAGAAQNATNGLGSAAFTSSSAYDAAGTALNATNGLGSAAFTSSSAYDAAGRAQNATNGLGSAAFTSSSAYDAAGTAQNATNGLGSAAFTSSSAYDAAGSASAVTNTITGGSLFGRVTMNRAIAVGTVSVGLDMTNSTPAVTGGAQANQGFAQQIHFGTQAWKNNATAASQPVDLWLTYMGVQGNASPTSLLVISNSINGGTPTDILHINSAGFMVIGASFNSGGNIAAGNGFQINWASSTAMRAPTDGRFEVRNSAETQTNFIALQNGGIAIPTNFSGTSMTPIGGFASIVGSNSTLYVVTQVATNPIAGSERVSTNDTRTITLGGSVTSTNGFVTPMPTLAASSQQTNYTISMQGDAQIITANTNANLTLTTPAAFASTTVLFNCITSTVDCVITLPANLLTNVNLNLRVTNGWAKALNFFSIDGSSTNILVSDSALYHR